jgi:hypothetical protein
MSKSTPGLLSAIEGYSAEHAGSPEHESNIKLLQRVAGEVKRGKGGDTLTDSPGAREAKAASQTNMPAEEDHSGGEGNKTTNRPGSFAGNEDVADPQDGSQGPLTGAGPAPSDGHLHSTLTGASMPSGEVDIRRGAALKALESGRSSEGNKESNAPGRAGPNEKRIGDVTMGGKTPPDRNSNGDGFEGGPPIAGKDQLKGDGWTRAREKARSMAPAR